MVREGPPDPIFRLAGVREAASPNMLISGDGIRAITGFCNRLGDFESEERQRFGIFKKLPS